MQLQPTELQPRRAPSVAPEIADLIGELAGEAPDAPFVARAILALRAMGGELAALRAELDHLRQEQELGA